MTGDAGANSTMLAPAAGLMGVAIACCSRRILI
jgi:hypothetical protein